MHLSIHHHTQIRVIENQMVFGDQMTLSFDHLPEVFARLFPSECLPATSVKTEMPPGAKIRLSSHYRGNANQLSLAIGKILEVTFYETPTDQFEKIIEELADAQTYRH